MNVANATTGIVLALRARGLTTARVGIPNGVCIQVPLAVLWSGNTPVYLDVDPHTLGLSTAILDAASPLDAVIFVHAYGASGHFTDVADWCRARGVFLIDDRAPSSPIGETIGDGVTVSSFGRGKIVDVGAGGRVESTDASLMREIARLETALPERRTEDEAALSALMTLHTRLYNTEYAGPSGEHVGPSFSSANSRDALAVFAEHARPLERAFVHRNDHAWESNADAALGELGANIARRAGEAARFHDAFALAEADGRLRCWRPVGDVAWWRFVLFVPTAAQPVLLRRGLDAGLPISTWFPPVDLFFAPRAHSRVHTPVADAIGATIVNLWVNDQVDDSYARAAVELTLDVLA